MEQDKAPVLIDSAGRLIRVLGQIGGGPGEFSKRVRRIRNGRGDTLFVLDGTLSVFTPSLDFVKATRQGTQSVYDFLPSTAGFVITAPAPGSDNRFQLFHVTDDRGRIRRSFGDAENVAGSTPFDRLYALGGSTPDAFWAVPYMQHRLERWTITGSLTMVIDTQPPWFVRISPSKRGNRSIIRSFREAGDRLWVMSSVPVPNADEIISQATGKKYTGVDEGGRPYPVEKLTTTMLEVYDVKTGKLLAALPVPAYGVGFIDDSHFVIYGTTTNDLPQLEVWEMMLAR